MNTIDFTQPGGFPFDQGVLDFLQKGSLMAGQPAFFGGPLCIISGCTVSGNSVSSGVVAINGEILPFAGGTITENEKVVIQESVTDITYFDAQARPVKKTRTAMFGDDGGVTNYKWTNFKRNTTEGVLARLERLERVAAPFLSATGRGGMLLWNKRLDLAPIPPGWAEVLDWRGRMPVGWNPVPGELDFETIGKYGGARTHKLLLSEIPSHTHSYNDIYHSEIGGSVSVPGNGGSGDTDDDNKGYQIARTTGSTGGGQSHPILNPYRVVMFIEYIGD